MRNFKLKGKIVEASTFPTPSTLTFKVFFDEPTELAGDVGAKDEVVAFFTSNTPANRKTFAVGAMVYVTIDVEVESQT